MITFSSRIRTGAIAVLAGAASFSAVQARDGITYEVKIANITFGQQFTPLLLVTHRPDIRLFTLGEPASSGLATLAEEGNVAPLRASLDSEAGVNMTEAGSTLTNPGVTATLRIAGHPHRDRLSIAAMLIPTNDAFMALDAVRLPTQGSVTYYARAYDAGSEVNDELCASIPGPNFDECGGPGGGRRVGSGEAFVHVHRGIHNVGNLKSANRGWMNPVAEITITRVH